MASYLKRVGGENRYFRWITLLLFVLALGILSAVRGETIAGFATLGPALGAYEFFEHGFFHSLFVFLERSRNYQYWNPSHSVLFGLGPGILTAVFPWPFWSHILNIVIPWGLTLACLHLLGITPLVFFALILLSPNILALSVTGYPYISFSIPYCLALMIIFNKLTISRRWLRFILETIAWVFVFETSLHVYEAGKTFFIVPLLAALFVSDSTRDLRLLRFVVGVAVAAYVLSWGGSEIHGATERTALLLSPDIFIGAKRVFKYFYLTRSADLPTLLTIGLLSFSFVKQHRWFWTFLFLSQFAILYFLAMNPEPYLHPRRASLMLWCAALISAKAFPTTPELLRKYVIPTLLCVGFFWSAYTFYIFTTSNTKREALPYIKTPIDFSIDKQLNADASLIASKVKSDNSAHVFLYGYSNYFENTTDPQAFPEKLMLRLGPSLYKNNVLFVDYCNNRYIHLPHIREERFILDRTQNSAPFYLHVFHKEDIKGVKARLLNSSHYGRVDIGLERFNTFFISQFMEPGPVPVPKASDSGPLSSHSLNSPVSGLCLSQYPGPEQLKDFYHSKWHKPSAVTTTSFIPSPPALAFKGPTSAYLFSQLSHTSSNNVLADLSVTADDEVRVLLNGIVAFESMGEKSTKHHRRTVILPSGVSALEIYYTDHHDSFGEFSLNIELHGNQTLFWTCSKEVFDWPRKR